MKLQAVPPFVLCLRQYPDYHGQDLPFFGLECGEVENSPVLLTVPESSSTVTT